MELSLVGALTLMQKHIHIYPGMELQVSMSFCHLSTGWPNYNQLSKLAAVQNACRSNVKASIDAHCSSIASVAIVAVQEWVVCENWRALTIVLILTNSRRCKWVSERKMESVCIERFSSHLSILN